MNDLQLWLEKRVKYRAELGCDNLAILTAWDLYDGAAKAGAFLKKKEEDWCKENLLSYAGLHEVSCALSLLRFSLMLIRSL